MSTATATATARQRPERTTTPARVVLLVLAAFVLAAGGGCSCDGDHAARPVDAGGPVTLDGTPVVLVTIDTLRADRVGVFAPDDPYITTPNLDALARRGTFYPHAYTVAPLTLPAHASIMTGRYPTAHKIRDNVNYRLAYEETTIAEVLRDGGYATAAFVSAETVHASTGLAQGFDVYDDELTLEMQHGFTLLERRGDETMDRALDWLHAYLDDARRADTGADARAPFFLWVHLFDPHYPYNPREDLRAEDKRRPADVQQGMTAEEIAVARHRARYDAEVTFADHQLGRLLQALDDAGLTDETLVVACSDHGEALGEHGEATHGYTAWPPTIRVPLIVAGPGYESDPEGDPWRLDSVSVTGIAPTVLDVCGHPELIEAQFHHLPRRGEWTGASRLVSENRPPATDWTPYLEAFLGTLAFGWAPVRGYADGNLAPDSISAGSVESFVAWSNPPVSLGVFGWPPDYLTDGERPPADYAERNLRHLLRAFTRPPLGNPVVPPRTAIGGGIDQAAYPGAGALARRGDDASAGDNVLATTFPARLFDESLDALEMTRRPSPMARIHILQGYQRAQRLAAGGKYPLARQVLGELLEDSEPGNSERAPILLLLTECWRLGAEELFTGAMQQQGALSAEMRQQVLGMYGRAATAYAEYVELMLAAGHAQSEAVTRDLREMLAIRWFFAGRYDEVLRILGEWSPAQLRTRGRLVYALALHYRGGASGSAFATLVLDGAEGDDTARLRELLADADASREPAEVNPRFGFP